VSRIFVSHSSNAKRAQAGRPEVCGLHDLKAMPPDQFVQVITGPAGRASCRWLTIAPDLVNRLLVDAAEGGDTLPLLALTLARLYDGYASSGEITVAHYEAMGGMRRVVQTAVDEVLSRGPERTHQIAQLRAGFIPWLVTVNPDTDPAEAPGRALVRSTQDEPTPD
jgi:hypothetical protein